MTNERLYNELKEICGYDLEEMQTTINALQEILDSDKEYEEYKPDYEDVANEFYDKIGELTSQEDIDRVAEEVCNIYADYDISEAIETVIGNYKEFKGIDKDENN